MEATTGPLGQGVSNAVGYAVSQKMAAAKYNTSHKIFDNHVIVRLEHRRYLDAVGPCAVAVLGVVLQTTLLVLFLEC